MTNNITKETVQSFFSSFPDIEVSEFEFVTDFWKDYELWEDKSAYKIKVINHQNGKTVGCAWHPYDKWRFTYPILETLKYKL